MIRSLGRENESADILASRGYRLEQKPQRRPDDWGDPNKNPDYRIEGRLFDNYAPISTRTVNVVSGINAKVEAKQADRIVVNLKDTDVSPSDLRQALSERAHRDLQEVLAIDKDGVVQRLYP